MGEMNQPMILQEPHPLSIAEILKKSFKFSERDDKSMVLKMFLVLVPFCLLLLGADLTLVHVVANIVTPMKLLAKVDPSSAEAMEMVGEVLKNVWLLLGVELSSLAFFSIASLFCIIAIVYTSSSSMQSRNRLNMKELFMKSGRPWMRQVITWFYVTAVMFVFIALVLISSSALSVRVTGTPLIVSCILMVILGTLSYVYLAAVWMSSSVVFVADIDFNEVLVQEQSKKFIEERRLQGFVLVLFASMIGTGLYAVFVFGTGKSNKGRDKSANGIVMLCYLCLMKLFMLLLYGVYYTEFKRRNHRGGNDVQQRLGYVEIFE